MKPSKSQQDEPQEDLFKNKLRQMIDHRHPLVRLAEVVDWERLDDVFGATYSEDNGRPAISTRLMVALQYLKYTFDVSDEDVVAGWVENPYWQHLSGMKYFEHELPIDPSSMTRWRKRMGEAGAEELLRETIASGLKVKAVKPSQLERLNVDTTVQEKHVRFPTDARLYDRARERLVVESDARGIELRQSYRRKSKHVLLQQSRYAHAKQYRRARKCTKTLRTYLGRVIRDIERKLPNQDEQLAEVLAVSRRIHEQKKDDSGKTYSVHAPEVECISKGKAHKRYEFGCKVSVAATSRGGWFVGARALHGNPYDGHTLAGTMEQVARMMTCKPDEVFVDRGYRGHDYEGSTQIHVDRVRRGNIAKSVWRWMKRRAAIEPGIGHLKHGHRMDRNRLKGQEGDMINAILSAAGMNFSKLLTHPATFLHLIVEALVSRVFLFAMPNPEYYRDPVRA
ncbi:MAG: IS5 family transposase [Deltaproteobacteria bacterium]|nr:IS5 family transposase [Deltaproteobacteria bacterium]